MFAQYEDFQKFGKEATENAAKSFGIVQKGSQEIAVEVADYTKKAFETVSSTVEKLMGVKTFDKAVEIQTDYVKSSYEGLVAHSTKLGELYQGLAKEIFKPFEAAVAPTKAANGK